MLSRLRGRLFLSYVLLMAVMLVVVGVALFAILNLRGAPPETTYLRLATTALSVDLRQILSEAATAYVESPAAGWERLTAELDVVAADREVRIRVAQRLDASMLVEMAGDPDYFVRKLVAQRLPLPLLPRMATDPDQEVRLAVASRLQVPALLALRNDREVAVRRVVVDRLPIGLLADMADDPAWEVRWEVAQRADPSLARRLLHDDEAEVCEAARLRLTTLDSEARHG